MGLPQGYTQQGYTQGGYSQGYNQQFGAEMSAPSTTSSSSTSGTGSGSGSGFRTVYVPISQAQQVLAQNPGAKMVGTVNQVPAGYSN